MPPARVDPPAPISFLFAPLSQRARRPDDTCGRLIPSRGRFASGADPIDLPAATLLWLVFAATAAAGALFAARALRVTPGILGLAILLGQQALSTLAGILAFVSTDPALAAFAFRVGVVLWLLWCPAVCLAGALLLRGTRSATAARGAAVVLGAPGVALLAGALAWPSLVFAPDGLSITNAAAIAIGLAFLAMAVFVAIFVHESVSTPLPLHGAQFALLAIAFGVEAGYHAGQNAAKVLFSFDLHGFDDAGWGLSATLVAPIGILAFAAARALGARSSTRERRRLGVASSLAILVAIATGISAAPLAIGDEFSGTGGMVHAGWDLVALVALVYAGLRYQLVSMHLRARQAVVVSLLVPLGFLAFGATQNAVEDVLEERYLAGIPAPGIVAALAVAALSVPLVKGAGWAARRWMPGTVGDPRSERRRNAEIYEAAVEGAFMDGRAELAETASLAKLRAALGITGDEHEAIESRVRRAMGMPSSLSPA